MTHLQGNFALAQLWLPGHTHRGQRQDTLGAWQDTPTEEFALAQLRLGHTQGPVAGHN